MMRIRSNQLLLWFVGLNTAYFAFGFFPPGMWLSAFVSACLIVFGSMLAASVLPDAVAVIKRGEVGAGELAVIAIATIAIGLTYSGVYNVLWNFAGRPDSWIGPFSAYGRAMTGVGLFLMFLSPEATRHGIKPPKWWIVIIGVGMIALLAFLFGATWNELRPIAADLDTTSGPKQTDMLFFRRA